MVKSKDRYLLLHIILSIGLTSCGADQYNKTQQADAEIPAHIESAPLRSVEAEHSFNNDQFLASGRSLNSLFVTKADDSYDSLIEAYETEGSAPILYEGTVYFVYEFRGEIIFFEPVTDFLFDQSDPFEKVLKHIQTHPEYYGNNNKLLSQKVMNFIGRELSHEKVQNILCRDEMCLLSLQSLTDAEVRATWLDKLATTGICKFGYYLNHNGAGILFFNPNECAEQT